MLTGEALACAPTEVDGGTRSSGAFLDNGVQQRPTTPDNSGETASFVLSIPDPVAAARISEQVRAHLDQEDGDCLEPLDQGRFLVAGTAGQLLLASGGEVDAIERLHSLDGVTAVEVWSASRVADALRGRVLRPADALAAVSAADQWYLDEVRVRPAWALFRDGLAGFGWRGIHVGQIDTGYCEHPVFGFGAGGYSPSLRPDLGRNFREVGQPPGRPLPAPGSSGPRHTHRKRDQRSSGRPLLRHRAPRDRGSVPRHRCRGLRSAVQPSARRARSRRR